MSFQDDDLLPPARSSHASVCLGYGSNNPQLLIHGGVGNDNIALRDLWLYSINLRSWNEVSRSFFALKRTFIMIFDNKAYMQLVLKKGPFSIMFYSFTSVNWCSRIKGLHFF